MWIHDTTVRLGALGVCVLLAGLAAASSVDEPLTTAAAPPAAAALSASAPAEPRPVVRAAHLTYAGGKASICFAANYLAVLDRETGLAIDRAPARIALDSSAVYDFPFAVLSGEGDFVLSEAEVDTLRLWLASGGFLLASAGCSNEAWDSAFRRELARVLADGADGDPSAPPAAVAASGGDGGDGESAPRLIELPADHVIFRTVFNIAQMQTRRPGEAVRLYGVTIDGRLAVLYSPQGLNDSGNAGGGCCCCGGSEIRHASYLNANALAYALMR